MEYEKSYWNSRYKDGYDSGYGSYGEQLEKKLNWLRGLDIASISEVGCGDFNFGRRLLGIYPDAPYTGYDISDVIVERNSALYPYATFTNDLNIPPADLLLCVDVLFHVKEREDFDKILADLEGKWTKYLALTAYEYDKELKSKHVFIHKFDPERFGTPVVREIVEEDGSLMFFLFRR